MLSINEIAQRFRSLNFGNAANGLEALLSAADANQQSYLQFAAALVDCEIQQRHGKRLELNHRKAGFPKKKSLEEFDYQYQTTITKRQINQLLDFNFIDNRENLIFIGPPGVGKTHLAIGIGIKAIDAGYKVLFNTALGLSEFLELAEIKGALKKQIAMLCKYDLLIIDELGYLPMNKQSNYNLFQLIHALYEFRSIIITTNKDFTEWGNFFSDNNVCIPIVDRIIHHSQIFMLGGESYRLKYKLNQQKNDTGVDQN